MVTVGSGVFGFQGQVVIDTLSVLTREAASHTLTIRAVDKLVATDDQLRTFGLDGCNNFQHPGPFQGYQHCSHGYT